MLCVELSRASASQVVANTCMHGYMAVLLDARSMLAVVQNWLQHGLWFIKGIVKTCLANHHVQTAVQLTRQMRSSAHAVMEKHARRSKREW